MKSNDPTPVEVRRRVLADIRAGAGVRDTARKYGLAPATVAKIGVQGEQPKRVYKKPTRRVQGTPESRAVDGEVQERLERAPSVCWLDDTRPIPGRTVELTLIDPGDGDLRVVAVARTDGKVVGQESWPVGLRLMADHLLRLLAHPRPHTPTGGLREV